MSKLYHVNRAKGDAIVMIVKNRQNEKYYFVNLSSHHVCSCSFDTEADALQDLQKKVEAGDILGYYEMAFYLMKPN